MRYRVFIQVGGDLHYVRELPNGTCATSKSLGTGPQEIDLIRQAHELVAGDVIYIEDRFIRLTQDSYEYLLPALTPEITYNGVPWSQEMSSRLYREAVAAERAAA